MVLFSPVAVAAGLLVTLGVDAAARFQSNAALASVGTAALPITDVVKLLKQMQSDLEREAKEDETTYNKLKCWCDSNKQSKATAVDDAQRRMNDLQATIEQASGRSGSLSASIEQEKQDVAEGETALADATAIRKKEASAFHSQEKDLLQSIQLLNGAITTLAKHHPAMLQGGQGADLEALRPGLRRLVHRHLGLLGFLRTSEQKGALLAFLNANADILEEDLGSPPAVLLQRHSSLRANLPYTSYAPQSGQIIGILRQMKDNFEAELPEAQKAEISQSTAFAEMKGAKESELQALRDSVETKTGELAAAKELLANSNSDLEDTAASMSADKRFMLVLIKKCTEGDHEWELRSKSRADEIAAVSEAIAVLSTDAVKDGQQTTFGFLQTSSQQRVAPVDGHGLRRASAVAFLQRAVVHSPALAQLLAHVRSDPFAKVIEAIDSLAEKLKTEMADEVKQRDFCIDELHENEVESTRETAASERLGAQISDLAAQGKAISGELATLRAEIAELQVELQRATEDRKEENHEFQRTVSDQRTARQALEQAHNKLASFYSKRQTLLQAKIPSQLHYDQQARAGPGSAPEFQDHQPHEKSNHVMTLILKLAGDAQVLEDASIHSEQVAQAAYEQAVQETNDSVEAKSRLVVDKIGELASVDQERVNAEQEKADVDKSLEATAQSLVAIHGECDFLLKNFGARQESRAAEADALAQVKAILRGMKLSATS
jgi:hypothetical protein